MNFIIKKRMYGVVLIIACLLLCNNLAFGKAPTEKIKKTVSNPMTADLDGAGYEIFNAILNEVDVIATSPWIDIRAYGAVADDAIDDTTEIQNAIDAIPSSGGTVFFPVGSYHITGLTIPDGKSNLRLVGYGSWLVYTPSTNAGIVFAGEADNFVMKDIVLYSQNWSSGVGIYSNNTSDTPLRDFVFDNVHVSNFRVGIEIHGMLNGIIRQGRFGGQGKTSENSVGIKIGEDVNHGGNMIRIRDVYVSAYKKGIWIKYASPAYVENPIMEINGTAFRNDTPAYLINPFDADNDVSIVSTSYLHHQYIRPPTAAVIYTGLHRYFTTPDAPARIDVYPISGQMIPSKEATRVNFTGENEDSEDMYNHPSNPYKFVPHATGYYLVNVQLTWDCRAAQKKYKAMIYKNGSSIAESSIYCRPLANPGVQSHTTVAVQKLVWLDAGTPDYIEAYAYHEEEVSGEGVASTVYYQSKNSFMNIIKLN